jgi:hypothetical protein
MQSVEKTWFERVEQEERAAVEEPLEEVATKDEKIYVASYWQLMRWRFLKHRSMSLPTGN